MRIYVTEKQYRNASCISQIIIHNPNNKVPEIINYSTQHSQVSGSTKKSRINETITT